MNTHIRKVTAFAIAVLTVVGVTLIGSSTAEAGRRRVVSVDIVDTTLVVVDPFFVNDEEFVSYVARAKVGNKEYGFAWFAKGPPSPWFGDLVTFEDRWELYESTDFYQLDDLTGALVTFTPGDPIMAGSERGFGSNDPFWFVASGRITLADVDRGPLARVDQGDRHFWVGDNPATVDMKIITR